MDLERRASEHFGIGIPITHIGLNLYFALYLGQDCLIVLQVESLISRNVAVAPLVRSWYRLTGGATRLRVRTNRFVVRLNKNIKLTRNLTTDEIEGLYQNDIEGLYQNDIEGLYQNDIEGPYLKSESDDGQDHLQIFHL